MRFMFVIYIVLIVAGVVLLRDRSVAPLPMRKFPPHNRLSIVFLALFPPRSSSRRSRDTPSSTRTRTATATHTSRSDGTSLSSSFGSAVIENWQSEYFQFTLFVLLTVWLVQRGSPKSRTAPQSGPRVRQRSAGGRTRPPRTPRAGRTWPGCAGAIYENSLLMVMGTIWVGTWCAQSITGVTEYNAEQLDHQRRRVSWLDYLGRQTSGRRRSRTGSPSSSPWGSMAILAVYLRQRGSPESKPSARPTTRPARTGDATGYQREHALLGPARHRAVPAQRARRAGDGGRARRLRRGQRERPLPAVVGAGRLGPGVGAARRDRPGHRARGVGTGVTAPVHRYHPAVVAQFAATLEELFPGRGFLGIGSGESLNESPCGMDWPTPAEQVERMEEALEIIDRLLDGERLDHEGRFFRTKAAYLHTRGERRPPSTCRPSARDAAAVAARLGDGLWTLADPEIGARADRRLPGGPRRRRQASPARSSSRPASPGRRTTTPRSRARASGRRPSRTSTTPTTGTTRSAMYEKAEHEISDEEFKRVATSSARTPSSHVERIREIERLGATVVCLQNGSGADPLAALAHLRRAGAAGAEGRRV